MDLSLTPQDVQKIFTMKHGITAQLGWSPRIRLGFSYFNPEDWYEAVMEKIIKPETRWLDVGCGRFLFPSNHQLASELSARCKLLVGVDPDPNLLENPYVHEKANLLINDYQSETKYDVISLRMVAEHISDPLTALDRLDHLCRPGAVIVIYTIFKWSPIPLVTRFLPFQLHHPIKKFLWGTESQDTFPVAYKMNTRKTLGRLFKSRGFQECYFKYLDDCTGLSRFRSTTYMELSIRKVLRGVGMPYPEVCLLGLYKKMGVCIQTKK